MSVVAMPGGSPPLGRRTSTTSCGGVSSGSVSSAWRCSCTRRSSATARHSSRSVPSPTSPRPRSTTSSTRPTTITCSSPTTNAIGSTIRRSVSSSTTRRRAPTARRRICGSPTGWHRGGADAVVVADHLIRAGAHVDPSRVLSWCAARPPIVRRPSARGVTPRPTPPPRSRPSHSPWPTTSSWRSSCGRGAPPFSRVIVTRRSRT